ncbi:MAG: hypothetical protein R8G66_04120 [Cytophagales bacterium]|nr:hypothetical protein [Cytophagales bacterium]
MYTSVDLVFSLLGIAAWLALVIYICRAIYLSNQHVPIALVLGVFFTLILGRELIVEVGKPLDTYFTNLIDLDFFSRKIIEIEEPNKNKKEDQQNKKDSLQDEKLHIDSLLAAAKKDSLRQLKLQNEKNKRLKVRAQEETQLSNQVYSPKLWSWTLLLLLLLMSTTWISRELVQLSNPTNKKSNNQNKHLKQNILIISTVAFAVYLSISSLVSLPVVTAGKMLATESEENKHEYLYELREEIDSLQKKDELFADDVLADLDQIMADIEGDDNNFSRVQSSFYQTLRTETDVQRLKIMETINIELPIGAAKLLTKMNQAEEANLTDGQRLEYKSLLYDWYINKRLDLIKYVKERNDLIRNLKKVGLDDYWQALGKSTSSDSIKIISIDEKMKAIPQYLQDKNALKQPKEQTIPEQPKQGDHLGNFAFIMGWLLSIESYSLVVIMGLVGFGLLGAIGSSFIKGRKQGHEAGALISDVPKTLISGFIAAIVVYLAIQGSVSLLSGGSTGGFSPNNGYLLFFIALTASVYSDFAWDWVKNRFKKVLKDEQ